MFGLEQKPEEWGFEAGLVAPEWDWVWEDPALLCPFWAGGGTARDLSPNRFVGTLENGAVWDNQAELGVFCADVAGRRVSFGTQAALAITTYTHFAVFRVRDLSEPSSISTTRWLNLSQDGYNLIILTDGSIEAAKHNIAAIQQTAAGVVTVNTVHAMATTYDETDGVHRFVVDGVDLGTATNAQALTHGEFALGSFRGNDSINSDDIDIIAYGIWPTRKSVSQLRQLTADPFGPFRMRVPMAFFVPAVGGFVPHNPLGHPLIGPFGGPI